MSRWQIAGIYLYSHDGRRLDLEFELSAVNILVGVSYSGKSSVIEVIDYCLGASECHIPGVVREATAWVGVVWRRDKSDMFVCRRVPTPNHRSSEEVFFAVGAPVAVPASAAELVGNTNRDGGLRQFEQALHIGDVSGETFTEREGTRISFRHAVPYLLQSDDVIVNKTTLFRGANDERRLPIADALPYFLGAVDEATARAETQLRQVRMQRDREIKRIEAAQQLLDRDRDRSLSLLTEAAQLHMIGEVPSDAGYDVISPLLQQIAGWVAAPGAVAEEDQLQGLYDSERQLRQRYAVLRRQLDAATSVIETAKGFTDAVESQRQRLDVISLFRRDVERETCPVCDAPLAERTPSFSTIDDALRRLDTELAEVGQDRPKVDRYARELSEELARVGENLGAVRARIAAVVSEADATKDRFSLDERRLRVAGRVSYHLEAQASASTGVDRTDLERLEAQIQELEHVADPAARADRVEALQGQVSIHATNILTELPFDSNYRACQIIFNVRQLSIRFVLGPRVMQMRDVGGDESYLSGHVATLLALHRVFDDGARPVPGVVVFDQLSRPFFPADKYRDEVQVRANDREDLKKYFDVLFTEVENRKTLQVIVLEHAFFADDPRYVRAVRMHWTNESRLIPSDWPKSQASGQS
jgi:hypothetical protein